MSEISDPRVFPQRPDAVHASLLDLAAASLVASSTAQADAIDHSLVSALAAQLRSGNGLLLSELVAAAPSFALARHLWRRLIDAWGAASGPREGDGLAATLFAMPIVVIAGGAGAADVPRIEGTLEDPERIASMMREQGALAGNLNFSLAGALVASDALDVPRLPALLEGQRRALAGDGSALDLPPTPIAVQAGQESVHLRFIVGHALAAPGVDLLVRADTKGWGLPLARELAHQLAARGISVLALPGAPQSPPAALLHGRAAQRAVGAQLFASNAIRRLRTAAGEPSAVISAHVCPGAPGGGELRLSLSSVFDPREAQGFRCPLFPTDAAGDVAAMLVELLRECRVTDTRVLPGVHPDRDPVSGLTLMFKPGALPEDEPQRLH